MKDRGKAALAHTNQRCFIILFFPGEPFLPEMPKSGYLVVVHIQETQAADDSQRGQIVILPDEMKKSLIKEPPHNPI